jgi:hypothetical protein
MMYLANSFSGRNSIVRLQTVTHGMVEERKVDWANTRFSTVKIASYFSIIIGTDLEHVTLVCFVYIDADTECNIGIKFIRSKVFHTARGDSRREADQCKLDQYLEISLLWDNMTVEEAQIFAQSAGQQLTSCKARSICSIQSLGQRNLRRCNFH